MEKMRRSAETPLRERARGGGAGRSANCPNPQQVTSQRRSRRSIMLLCLAKCCELGQLALREKVAARRGLARAARVGRVGSDGFFSHGLNTDETWNRPCSLQTVSCGQKSLPAASKPVCADNLAFRAGIIRFVRPFSRPCGANSICAGDWPFRARQLPVRAGKNQSVRPLFDSCGETAGLWAFLMVTGGQKETV